MGAGRPKRKRPQVRAACAHPKLSAEEARRILLPILGKTLRENPKLRPLLGITGTKIDKGAIG